MALALPAMDLHGATWTNFAVVKHGMVQQPFCTFGTLPRPVMGPNVLPNVLPQKFGGFFQIGGRNKTQLGRFLICTTIWGRLPILTNIFQMGWFNDHLEHNFASFCWRTEFRIDWNFFWGSKLFTKNSRSKRDQLQHLET